MFHFYWRILRGKHLLSNRLLQSVFQYREIVLNCEPHKLKIELIVVVDSSVTKPRDLFPRKGNTLLEYRRESLGQFTNHGKLHDDRALNDFTG